MFKKISTICLVVCLVTLMALTGCKQVEDTEDTGGGGDKTSKTDAGDTGAVEPAAGETIIVTMDGGKETITWEELDQVYHIERMRRRIDDEQVRKLLDNLIRQHLVYLDGLNKGYDKDPDYIRQVEMAKRQYMNRITMRKLAEQRIDVPDEELKAYYDDNPDEFHMLKVQYIMFPLRQYGNDKAKAREDAEKALAEIGKGKTLEEVSQKYLNRSRPFQLNLRKGQFSYFGQNFDDELWSIETGAVTGVVETPQGFVIARKLEEITQTFEEARAFIKAEMTKEKSAKRMEDYYSGLETKYKLEVDEPAINKKMDELGAPDMPGPSRSRPPMPPPATGTVEGGNTDQP